MSRLSQKVEALENKRAPHKQYKTALITYHNYESLEEAEEAFLAKNGGRKEDYDIWSVVQFVSPEYIKNKRKDNHE